MFAFSTKLWYETRRVNKTTGETSLYLQVVIDGKHKELPLKLKWPIQFIDLKNGKLLPRFKNDPDCNDYNIIIESQRAKHNEINRVYRIKQEYLNLDKLTAELQIYNQRECFATYLNHERKKRYARREITLRTCQAGHVVLMRILDFDKLCLFKDIDAKWMKRFKAHLNSLGYKPATVWNLVKHVKVYLKLASMEALYYVNEAAIKFPNTCPRAETVYLNKSEIKRIVDLLSTGELTDTETAVTKAFLFTCFTSLRISDLYQANIKWHVESDFLDFIPYKGRKAGEKLRIPLTPIAKSFIENIDGQFFNLPAMPVYNRYLKTIAKKAEIKKKLTAHVGRHTFGYLFMTTIGNLKALQEILGHKVALTTERYAHLDDEYKLNSVKEMQKGFNFLAIA